MKLRFSQIDRDVIRQVLTLASILAAFGANVFSNVAPVGGATIGEIVNTQFGDLPINPANYAFAIWGVIYLGLFGFGGYQMHSERRTHPILRRSGWGVIIASWAQIAWVWLFQMQFFVASVGAMLVILLALIYGYPQLESADRSVQSRSKFWVDFPLSIYLGWISIATIPNIAIALTAIGWQGGAISPTIWAAILIVAVTGLGAIVCGKYRDFAFTAVAIWALVAIAVRQQDLPLVAGTASLGAIGLGVSIVWTIAKRNVRKTE